jgi:hypothetical protein
LQVRARAALVLLVCGALAGCGEDDDAGDLLDRLPGDARALSVIDLAAVKERLGLPEDADPPEPPREGGGSGAQARLFGYAGGAFP